jgi:ABC-type glutathione transport system ATPase component
MLILFYEAGLFRKVEYIIFKKKLNQQQNSILSSEQANMEQLFGDVAKDTDVINEETRIANLVPTMHSEEILIVDRLTKYYSRFMAVKGISFSVKSSECFGLLGKLIF